MIESLLKKLEIKGKEILVNIVQGGMGIGISRRRLANAVANEGGFGNLSSAGLDKIISKEKGRKISIYDAIREECEIAKSQGGYIGINIMEAVVRDYVDSVRAAIDAKIDAICVGAGLPLSLPSIQNPGYTALIPIISSYRALEAICKRWERFSYRPDAAVLEGPKAGGHLGFKFHEIFSPEFTLEKLFPRVKEVAMKYGDFPIIVAGGIYTHDDHMAWQRAGADGCQYGTRFLATHESSASDPFKEAVINCSEEDIVIAESINNPPGSPCKLPFRVIKQSPMFQKSKLCTPLCVEKYVLQKDSEGKLTQCPAKHDNENYFCICRALFSAAGYGDEMPMWTVGSNGWRVKEIMHVKNLMNELKGLDINP
jgi:nitronate monooxygenase